MIARDVPIGLTQIAQVVANSPAQEAGLKKGDVIFAINDHEVRNLQEAGTQIRLNLGETLTMQVKREGDFLEIPVHARWAAPDIVHVVEPDESASSVASLLGVAADSIREAAGIEYRLTEGQQLAIQDENHIVVSYEIRAGDSVASVARALGVDEEPVRLAAGLPDPEALAPGQKLRLEQGPTGIMIGSLYPGMTESESFPLWEAFPKSIDTTFEVLTLARNEFISWFKGGGRPQVAGPVGIAQVTGEVVEEQGYRPLLDFAALLSINLAIINILPLPMLDGGRIMFVLLEIARRGKRVAPEKEALVHFIGLVLILTLAVVITYFDVLRVLRGESLFR
jgi:membrane-associated protease RseP (regulator of RpoE activity)